LWASAVYD